MSILKSKSDSEILDDYIKKFRKKYVPKNYNQIEMLDELTNDDVNHYISISNRTDGKSFNYIHCLLNLVWKFELGLTLVSRHYTLRVAYQNLIEKIVDKSNIMRREKLYFKRTDFYIMVMYDNKKVALITDLNAATDIKVTSNLFIDFPIMVYDEFLALEDDYESNEWEKLRTIYASINRDGIIPYIHFPKIIYLGNAVNFSSPVLAYLHLYKILENHKINTMKIYDDVCLEMRRNENANERRNLRAFREENDAMTTGKFEINSHNLASENDIYNVNKSPHEINVKITNECLKIRYNDTMQTIILSITNLCSDPDYCLKLKDVSKNIEFLDNDKYFRNNYYKKYNKNIFLFENQYSKDVILKGNLINLNIIKIIKNHEIKQIKPFHSSIEEKEKTYERNQMEEMKKKLIERYF